MKKSILWLVVAAAALGTPLTAFAEPPKTIVSIYRAVPGRQLDLLKWFAQQDEVAKAAGVPAATLYVHRSGASWDFVWISPDTTPEQDKAIDAAAKKMGVPSGPKSGLALRELIAEHTDTLSEGPISAADWLKEINK